MASPMGLGGGVYSWADVYPNSPLNPNDKAATTTAASSGKDPTELATAPALSWVAIVLVLVALRVTYELFPES